MPLKKSEESESSLLQTDEGISRGEDDYKEKDSESFSQLLFGTLNRTLTLGGELMTSPESETVQGNRLSEIFDDFMSSLSLKAILDKSEHYVF